jgi:hypothetical protein
MTDDSSSNGNNMHWREGNTTRYIIAEPPQAHAPAMYACTHFRCIFWPRNHIAPLVVMPTWEQRVAHEQLCQDAAKAPHIDLTTVPQAQDDLWAAVEAALHVRVHLLVHEAAAAKVNDLDGRALRCDQQHVLWLEVAVDELVATQEPAGKKQRYVRR